MKKITLLTIASICLFALHSSAQITKGSVLLGGGISGSHNKSEIPSQVDNNSSFSISPAVGLAIKENTVVGIRLSFYHSKSEQKFTGNNYLQESTGNIAGLFYRRYLSLGKKFYLFGEGVASYTHNRTKTESSNPPLTTQTNSGFSLTIYPGVAFAVNRKIHLEVALNDLFEFNYTNTKTEAAFGNGTFTTTKASGFGAAANFSTAAPLSVGFRFVLGK